MRYLFLLFGMVYLPCIYAQHGSIAGTITHEGKAVPFATVQVVGSIMGVSSNEEGKFNLSPIPVGNANIKISAVGFRTQSFQVPIVENEEYQLTVLLEEDFLGLNEVVVSGTRYKTDRQEAPVIVNVLSPKLIRATQSVAVSEGLNYQPGVRVETNCQNCGFTQVRLNGLDGGYSQILINGRAVFSALNSVYGLDQIPTHMVEQIEVVRGGGSALYGSNAIAGTINIITKDPAINTWEVGSYISSLNNKALDKVVNLNGSIVSDDLNSGVTLYGMLRDRDSFDANGDGFTELVTMNNNILGTKAFFKPNSRSKITMDFSAINEYRRGGNELNLAPHLTDITEELNHNTIFTGLTYDHWTPGEKNKISIYASGQFTERDSYYGGLGGGRTAADSLLALNAYGTTTDRALVAGTQFTHYFPHEDVLVLGVENQNYNTDDEILGYNRAVNQTVNSLGIFGQYEWKPTKRLKALLGARYDITRVDGLYQLGDISRNANNTFGVLSPRVTLMYKLSSSFQLRAGYARGFRAPQAFNEDLHISSVGGEPQFVILSEGLQKETSNAYTASINYSSSMGLMQWNFLTEGFFTDLINPFTQVSTGAILPNGSIVKEVRNGQGAVVYGANFEAGFSPSKTFSFQLGGTLQKALYDETQVLYEPLNASLFDETVVAVDEFVRTPNIYGFFNSNMKFRKNFDLDFTGTYTGSMVVPRVVSETGFLNLIKSNPFFDANVKATYHIDLRKQLHLELSGGVKNVFNSFQNDFDIGAGRDSDYVYGPAAPRSLFLALKIGNFN